MAWSVSVIFPVYAFLFINLVYDLHTACGQSLIVPLYLYFYCHFSVFYQRPLYGIDNCVLFLRNVATYADAIAVQHPNGTRPVVLEILFLGHCKPKTGPDH